MPAALSDLEQQNPNIRSQIQEWQRGRTSNGQNPTDWDAFRQHAMGIGAPDPGQEAPREFMQSAAGAESSASSGTLGGQQPQPPQPQPQNRAILEAIKIRNDYEADKNTPTDRWLKARGMTQAELDAALKLAASAEGGR